MDIEKIDIKTILTLNQQIMKKFMFWAMALAVALVSCQKTETEKAPEITAETLEFTLPAEGTEEEPIYITFNSPVDWTATVSSDAKEWLTISPAKGTAGKASVKVIALSNTELPQERTATVSVTASTAKAEFKLTQLGRNDFTFVDEDQEAEIDEKGGTIEIEVMTNVEFKASVYEGSDWLHIVADSKAAYGKQTVKVTVDPYTEYDGERTGEIKFEVSGEVIPDGVAYYTISQNGPSTCLWSVDMHNVMTRSASYVAVEGDATAGTAVSLAIWGDKLVVCSGDGSAPVLLNKATGEKTGTLDTGTAKAMYVTNDDAGNLVFCNRVYNYWTSYAFFTIWYMKPGDTTPTKLVSTADSKYYPSYIGSGLNVRGDVTKNAAIVAPWEGVPNVSGENMLLAWNVTNGVAEEYKKITATDFPAITWWTGYWCEVPLHFPGAALLGNTLNSGMLMSVYDSNTMCYVDAEGKVQKLMTLYVPYDYNGEEIDAAGNYNSGCIDVRTINGAMFGAWELSSIYGGGIIRIYNSDKTVIYQTTPAYYLQESDAKDPNNNLVSTTAAIRLEAGENNAINFYHISNSAAAIEAYSVPNASPASAVK